MIFSIFISIVLLLIIQYFLKKYNLQHTTYNTASLSLSNITPKLYETLIASFEQFTNTTSFITYFYKYITLCLTLSSVYVLITRCYRNTINFFLLFVLLLGLNLSSVITNLIAQNTLYVLLQPRIEFFGILYIYIFSASVLFISPCPKVYDRKGKYKLQNI